MNIINIYFIGDQNSLISSIFLHHLIKFSNNNKRFKLTHIINSSNAIQQKKISKIKNKIILLIFFLFNRKYFERLYLIEDIKSKYKIFSEQAKSSGILFDNFDNFSKKKIKKKIYFNKLWRSYI